MPLSTRTIQPVAVSRIEVDPSIQNELECVTNNTLSNIIRQLSGLSKYAEDMFMELTQEATNVFTRSTHLQRRIDNLRDKVTQLNATVEEVSLQDIHLRKPFKSSIAKEQQVICRNTVPRAILESYTKCNHPPALDKLNEFREDGKDSMKFYTDPGYFFELWVAEMEKDFQHKKAELHKKRQKRRPRDQTQHKVVRKVVTKKEQWEALKHGQELSEYHVPDIKKHIDNQVVPANMVQINNNASPNQRPDSINIQKQHSISRKDSQKHNYQHTEKPEGVPSKPIQNGPVQIPYNQVENLHLANQISQHVNHISQDVKNSSSNIQYRPSERSPGLPLKDSPSGGRDILPPPPPPPPAEHLAQHHQSSPYRPAPDNQRDIDVTVGSPRHLMQHNANKNSPAKHPISSPQISMDQSMDLPPPPLSPKDNTPDTPISMESMPPPPSPPPPLEPYGIQNFAKAPTPPPPPPPPPPPMDMKLQNGHLKNQADVTSISSTGSTMTSASCVSLSNAPAGKAESDRSALLEEIRIGTRLKKMTRLEEKEEKKKMPVGRLDVQAIMDKAFEMRRRVIEDSESEEEEADSDENDW